MLDDAAAGGFMSNGVKNDYFLLKKNLSYFCVFFQSTNVILKYIKQSKSLKMYKPFMFSTGSALTSGCISKQIKRYNNF